MKNFNIKYTTEGETSLEEIRTFEAANNIKFPSDYVDLLLNHHGFYPDGDLFGIYDKARTELASLQSLLYDLDRFKMFNFEWDEDFHDHFNFKTDTHFGIMDTVYNGLIVMGCTKENENKIFIDLPQEHDRLIELAPDFYTFINQNVKIIEG